MQATQEILNARNVIRSLQQVRQLHGKPTHGIKGQSQPQLPVQRKVLKHTPVLFAKELKKKTFRQQDTEIKY